MRISSPAIGPAEGTFLPVPDSRIVRSVPSGATAVTTRRNFDGATVRGLRLSAAMMPAGFTTCVTSW